MIILPTQARDKDRQSTQERERRFLAGARREGKRVDSQAWVRLLHLAHHRQASRRQVTRKTFPLLLFPLLCLSLSLSLS
eukprot:COSAG06_NODE_63585_length_262_cov_0.539877_1_plen_78_part_10